MRRKLGVDRYLLDGSLLDGDVAIEDGVVAELGLAPAGTSRIATPGFVDLQVNGYAGVDFAGAAPDDYATAAEAMAAAGVTSYQPTFVSLPTDQYEPALEVAAEAARLAPGFLGVHLEGPFLTHPGAHNPTNLAAIDPDLLARLMTPVVTWMTLAAELAGVHQAIRSLVSSGRVAAVGHSRADAAEATAAFEAGATSVTHIFNAQSGWDHRSPGVAAAALANEKVTITLIADEHHLSPETIVALFRLAGDRCALITDAIAAAGLGDGPAELGDRSVVVRNGKAALSDGTIAGAVASMDQAVRHVHSLGVGLAAALASASEVPAAALHRPSAGSLAVGSAADIAILDDRLEVQSTIRAGVEVFAA